MNDKNIVENEYWIRNKFKNDKKNKNPNKKNKK